MTISRRAILKGAGAISLLGGTLGASAAANASPGVTTSGDRGRPPVDKIPPILFVHGNGDHAALWLTTMWRMESNGVRTDRMFALNFTNPEARNDDSVEQENRSSTEDQRREIAQAVEALKRRTGAARIAIVAQSRGGNSARNYIKNGGGANVSHAVVCGTPCHGVFNISFANTGSEFNGASDYLRGLNDGDGDTEVTAGTAFLTLRSDNMDKFAQSDGYWIGNPGADVGGYNDSPALIGATNLMLGDVDHRETGYSPRAFREIYKFLAGREPSRIEIVPENKVELSGLVTGWTQDGKATNLPVSGAFVDIYRVSGETGERTSYRPLHRSRTRVDGRWEPVRVDSSWHLEFVLTVPGFPTTHIYRSPFLRSSDIVHLRPALPLAGDDATAGAVVRMQRPRGYFGLPRDIVLLDGKEAADIKTYKGVPADAVTTARLPASEVGRPVIGIFNQERIVARAWPASQNRVTIAELTY